jgi:similar to stage IV sporulation protein
MRSAAVLAYRGFMPEKFIAHALAGGVRMLKIQRCEDGEVRFFLTERNAEKLMELARRRALNVRWVAHSARGEAKRAALRRISLVPAFAIFVWLLCAAASRVWLIEFTIDRISADTLSLHDGGQALSRAISALGVRPGVPKSLIDTDDMEMALLREAPEYAYIGVKLTGVRLSVEAVHELPAPEIYDVSTARDLVAGADGIITHIDVFAGAANVKPGDAVRSGQVLIRGEERVTDEATRGVCALGEVRARCWVSGEAQGGAMVAKKT